MRPSLFSLFGVSFPAYFVLLVTGFLFATTMGAMWARRVGEDPDVIIDLGLAMILTGVLGGRVHHVLFDGSFEPLNAWVSNVGGSDHLPVVVHLEEAYDWQPDDPAEP